MWLIKTKFLTFLHQLHNLSTMSLASQDSDCYCPLVKLFWMNAAIWDRLCIDRVSGRPFWHAPFRRQYLVFLTNPNPNPNPK